ncbi:MAG: hypothetical protein ACRDPC_09440 [Solirubrobacteraceae bacterium]
MRSAAGTAASHAVTRSTLIAVELVLALNAIAGVVVLGWIVVETLMIGLVSWMQPTTFAVGLLITALSIRLRPAGQREA